MTSPVILASEIEGTGGSEVSGVYQSVELSCSYQASLDCHSH